MRLVDPTSDLRLLLVSRHPLIVVRVDDEARFLGVLRRAATDAGMQVWTWSAARGFASDGLPPQPSTADITQALSFADGLTDPSVFVFLDVEAALADAKVVRRLKEFALEEPVGQTIVLTSPDLTMPAELDGVALPWTLEPPDVLEVAALVRHVTDELAERGLAITLDDGALAALTEAVRGISLPEAERLILREAMAEGGLDHEDVADIREAKAELLADDGVLELVPTDARGLAAVGGLEALKDWLRVRGRGFEPEARAFGLDAPRGVLLTGVPGCGKSLVAKTLARTWGLPLVLLDPGAIYGSFVGESEARMRRALRTVEAMAPVVLWVDEIEKGFAASQRSGDGGTSMRVLGSFLRWLQERPDGVFLVATCNDIGALPPELLRRGRFDEAFFVDLPDADERAEILALQLRERDRDATAFDLDELAARTEGFSGAELEGVVVAALYRAFADGAELTTGRIEAEALATTPLARSRADEIAAMRAWADGRAVFAGATPPRRDPDP
jgi:SpoVK/Ycf46/Vps4 family AAA+-type ATPase